MNRSIFPMAALVLLCSLLLAACNKPKTPQEASTAFWHAVIEGKASAAASYSTLTSKDVFDGFDYDWTGMVPSWGRVIIDDKEARIHTHISKPDASESEMLYFDTYLVRQGDEWKVDYEKTGKAVRASIAVSEFVNRITAIGNEISRQVEDTGNEISRKLEEAGNTVTGELEAMNAQLLRLADSLGTQASITIEEYSLRLQEDLDSLAESIEKALKEQKERISPDDRQTMENTVDDLNQTSKKLAQPDMQGIAETGEVVVITRENLDSLNKETFSQYRDEWKQRVDRFLEDMNKMINDLTEKSGQK